MVVVEVEVMAVIGRGGSNCSSILDAPCMSPQMSGGGPMPAPSLPTPIILLFAIFNIWRIDITHRDDFANMI